MEEIRFELIYMYMKTVHTFQEKNVTFSKDFVAL